MFSTIKEFPQSQMPSNETSEKRVRLSRDKRNGTVTISLRIPEGMLSEVDSAVKRRPYKMPRHMWLLEAIHEKLARTQNEAESV